LREVAMNRTKLLLVDDEEDFVFALAERLRFRKYDTRAATSGEAALSEIEKERPDIVVLDLKMPGMGGMEVLREIKTRDPSIDVIMLTGSVDSEIGEIALRAGATYHIVKPMDIEDLMKKLQDIEKQRGLH
jgi:two-component system response regulator CpxR